MTTFLRSLIAVAIWAIAGIVYYFIVAPYVGCDFRIAFSFDFTFWLHLTAGFGVAALIWITLILGIERSAISASALSSVVGQLLWVIHGGCCSAQGANVVDLAGGIGGAVIFLAVTVKVFGED